MGPLVLIGVWVLFWGVDLQKQRVIGALGMFLKDNFLGMHNFWGFIWLIFGSRGNPLFRMHPGSFVSKHPKAKGIPGTQEDEATFHHKSAFRSVFCCKKIMFDFSVRKLGKWFPSGQVHKIFAKRVVQSTTVEWDGHFRCVSTWIRSLAILPQKNMEVFRTCLWWK